MAAIIDKTCPPDGAIHIETGNTDKLPVVELRPFMTKQWRPCKSIPDFYDSRSLPATFSPRKAGPGSLISDTEAEIKKLNDTPRLNPNHDRNSCRKTTLQPPRPQTEGISIDGEQAFATYIDREKSTVNEIKNGGSKIVFSCFRRAMSDLDLRKQQDIRINGRKMEDLPPPKGNMMYAEPWEFYRCNKSYTIPDGSVSQSLPSPDALDNMYLRLENIEYAYMDESIYDAFDRSSTLPSINVRNAPMKIKRPRTERGFRQPSGKVARKPGYRLGVANSLDVLSHYGRPVEVEEHLSNELKRTISQIKKTKDLRFIDSNVCMPINRHGGSHFSSRYSSSENVSESTNQHNPDTFRHRERSQKQQMLAQRSRVSPSRLNLEGASVMSSHSLGQIEDSKTPPAKKSQHTTKGRDDVLHRGNRALIASRSSLSSSVPSAAVSARALSMIRAETLPAIAPGSGVLGFKEMTSSRSRFLSNSAPEARGHVMNSTREVLDSGKSTGQMPKINETGPKASPASSRSSISSGIVLNGTNEEEFNENNDDIDPVVIDSPDDTSEAKEKDPIVKDDSKGDDETLKETSMKEQGNEEGDNIQESEPNMEEANKESNETSFRDADIDRKTLANTTTDTVTEDIEREEDITTNENEIILDENSNVVHVTELQNAEGISSTEAKESGKQAPQGITEEQKKSPEPTLPEPFTGHNEIL